MLLLYHCVFYIRFLYYSEDIAMDVVTLIFILQD